MRHLIRQIFGRLTDFWIALLRSVWYGFLWFGVVEFGLVFSMDELFGVVEFGLVWMSLVSFGLVWCG